jgi:hypothetical protein
LNLVPLSDGTTAILSIPAAAHSIDPHPYTVPLGIRNESTAGFKLVLGASVSAIAVGGFVGGQDFSLNAGPFGLGVFLPASGTG